MIEQGISTLDKKLRNLGLMYLLGFALIGLGGYTYFYTGTPIHPFFAQTDYASLFLILDLAIVVWLDQFVAKLQEQRSQIFDQARAAEHQYLLALELEYVKERVKHTAAGLLSIGRITCYLLDWSE